MTSKNHTIRETTEDSFVDYAGFKPSWREKTDNELGSVSSINGICAFHLAGKRHLYLDFVYGCRRWRRAINFKNEPSWRSISIFCKKFMREVSRRSRN